jgi:hypothetical protein
MFTHILVLYQDPKPNQPKLNLPEREEGTSPMLQSRHLRNFRIHFLLFFSCCRPRSLPVRS